MKTKKRKQTYLKVIGVSDSGRPTAEYFRITGRKRVQITSREYYESNPREQMTARKQGGKRGAGKVPGAGHCWPLRCEALACHSSQVEAFNAAYKDRGVNVEVDKKGFVHIPDEGAYRRFRKVHGAYHRNSYNG